MDDKELLRVAESVLVDAIEEAAFSERPKDIEYAQMVAQKVERLRAKIAGRDPVELKLHRSGSRIVVEYSMGWPGRILKGHPGETDNVAI